MTIKEKAKEYLMNFPENSTFSIEEMIVNAFVAGAKSNEPKWNDGSKPHNLKQTEQDKEDYGSTGK